MMKRTRLRHAELERQLGQSLDVINSVTAAHDVTRAELEAARFDAQTWAEVATGLDTDLSQALGQLEAANHYNRQLCALSQRQNATIRGLRADIETLTAEREHARNVAVLLEAELDAQERDAKAARHTALQAVIDDEFRDARRAALRPQVVVAA